jgi:hypothetical protein
LANGARYLAIGVNARILAVAQFAQVIYVMFVLCAHEIGEEGLRSICAAILSA